MSAPKSSGNAHAKKTSSAKQPKVFDIRRPGKALASPTSRPVITPPKVTDDVLIKKSTKPSRIAADPDEQRTLMDSSKKVTIQPASTNTPAKPAENVVTRTAEPLNDAPQSTLTSENVAQKPAPPTINTVVQSTNVPPAKQTNTPAPATLQPVPAEPKVATSIDELLRDSYEPPTSSSANAMPPKAAQSSEAPKPAVESTAPPKPSESAAPTKAVAQPSAPAKAQTSEEFLASTTPPEIDMSHAVISTRVSERRHLWREVLVIIGLVLFVVAIIDLLLDANVLSLHGLPHTHLLKN